ncbi:MAG: HAD-IA family hydrolase [Gammaproteobacteria bacterium]
MAEPGRRWDLVVFDWDGTLMDSTAQIVEAARRAIAELGLPPREEAQVKEIIGLGLKESWHRLFPELAGEDHFGAFVESYRGHFFSSELHVARPFERVDAMLEGLRRGGYGLAVATGKSRRGLDRDFERTGLGRLFCGSRTADETRSKPEPDMLLELLEATGVPASRAVMVGDTEWDLEMARRAGVASVGVGWGAHSMERLRRLESLACFEVLDELWDWLQGRQPEARQGAG